MPLSDQARHSRENVNPVFSIASVHKAFGTASAGITKNVSLWTDSIEENVRFYVIIQFIISIFYLLFNLLFFGINIATNLYLYCKKLYLILILNYA